MDEYLMGWRMRRSSLRRDGIGGLRSPSALCAPGQTIPTTCAHSGETLSGRPQVGDFTLLLSKALQSVADTLGYNRNIPVWFLWIYRSVGWLLALIGRVLSTS